MFFKKITIIGIGLLGGSLGLAIRKNKLAEKVVGLLRREEACKEALRLGILDKATLNFTEAVRETEFIILATPLSTMRSMIKQLATVIKHGTVVTDVGSVKGTLVHDLEQICVGKCFFVGSHPMAGSDKSGMSHADADIFSGTPCIVTPTCKTHGSAQKKVITFWQLLNARVFCMDPDTHDAMLAYASHMPHVVSACIVTSLKNAGLDIDKCLQLTGKGWKDTTRIAASSPHIWGDILRENRNEVLKALIECKNELAKAIHAVKSSDQSAIEKIFARAKRIKDLER